MTFEEILVRFRTLGGIAENLELRHGEYGRGLFAVNSKREVRLHVPSNLLIDPQWLMLDSEEHLRVRPLAALLSADAVDFFELYQKHFGWGNGGKDSVAEHQRELQALPPKIKNFLQVLGAEQELKQKPSSQYCLSKYFVNRQIKTSSGSRLMPIAELINHAHDGLPYVVSDGITVSGAVDGEIRTTYHSELDPFHFFINYHFATPAYSALSCEVIVEIPEFGILQIKRADHLADVNEATRSPRVDRKRNRLNLSFVELADQKNTLQPRTTFVNLMKVQNMQPTVSNELFDGLVAHNKQVLSELIHECRKHSGTMVRTVEMVASYQLNLLS